MRFTQLLCATLLVLAGCSAQSPTGDSAGDDELADGKADSARVAPNAMTALTRLKALLDTDGVVRMPPPGRKFHANEMTVTADLVTVPADDLRSVVSAQTCAIGAKYDAPCGAMSFPLFAHPDAHATYLGGWAETTVKTQLVSQVISSSHQSAVRALLDALGQGTWVRMTMYDSGSEIIGDDLFILQPSGTDKALVLRVEYVQS